MRGRCALALFLLGSPFLAFPASAAASTITGTVLGPDRATIPGAIVTIRNVTSGESTTVVTAESGVYRASGLAPGSYTVRVEMPGFASQVGETVLRDGISVRLDFILGLSVFREQVEVVGAVPADRLEVTDRVETGARDVAEVLKGLAGVTLLRKAGIANDVLIGAYQGENVTVLIDGARLHGACPSNMDPPTAHADLSEVARIEIGKGPFDVKNQGSLGGVLNVVTARPGRGFHGEGNFALGSAGFVNPSATIAHGTDRISGLLGWSYRTSGVYRDGAGRRFTQYANYRPEAHDTDAFNATTLWARAYAAPLADHTLRASYTRQQLDHVLYPYLQMDGIADTAERFSSSFEAARVPGGFRALSVSGYFSRVRHSMTDEFRVTAAGARGFSMGTAAGTRTAGGKVQTTRGLLVAGAEVYHRQWDATTRFARSGYTPQYALPDVVSNTGGVFAEVSKPAGRLTIEAGGRVDRTATRADRAKANLALYQAYHRTQSTERADTYASGKVRLTAALGGWRIGAGIGHTARPPDPQERYYGLVRMGSDWVGDPDLPPVKNTGLRVDASYRRTRLLLDVAAQYDIVQNFITAYGRARLMMVPGVMNTVARSFAAVDARIAAAEARASYSISDTWFVTGLTSFTRGTKSLDASRGIRSTRLAEIPPLHGRVSIRHDRGVVFGDAEWEASARQSLVDTDLTEQPTPGNGILNLRAGVRVKRVRFSATIGNVFDRWYYEHLSAQRDPFRSGIAVREPGRNLHTSVVYRW